MKYNFNIQIEVKLESNSLLSNVVEEEQLKTEIKIALNKFKFSNTSLEIMEVR